MKGQPPPSPCHWGEILNFHELSYGLIQRLPWGWTLPYIVEDIQRGKHPLHVCSWLSWGREPWTPRSPPSKSTNGKSACWLVETMPICYNHQWMTYSWNTVLVKFLKIRPPTEAILDSWDSRQQGRRQDTPQRHYAMSRLKVQLDSLDLWNIDQESLCLPAQSEHVLR